MPSDIALFCLLHPDSSEKKDRVIRLLKGLREYYRTPKSQCTTWCYFTPSTRPKAPNTLIKIDQNTVLVAGMEIYTDKSALSAQLEEEAYKSYHSTIKREGLYRKDEDLIAYYPTAGFVARGASAEPYGKGITVMIAKFTLKGGEEERDKALKILGPYADWVKDNEPGVLTYSVLTRPKAKNEILMFERYKDLRALQGHGSSQAFKAMFKQIRPLVANMAMSEFEELDGTFVENAAGKRSSGGTQNSKL